MIKYPKFNSEGLVPAVAQDARTGRVLMQAYMNKEAYEQTLKTGNAVYYSRSRKELWEKGATSGNTQKVTAVYLDCDQDCVLLEVISAGPACHTGEKSCFFEEVKVFEKIANSAALYDDMEVILDRKFNPVEKSYTNYLFDKGLDKVCKKIGEEATEIVIAAKSNDNEELKNEIADLIYHVQVLMAQKNLTMEEVFEVLKSRRETERKRDY
jgi:phosphoribosyl-ATP pyrophosphohydrolase/phosphoribosyl-AMP cyclohydrolase